MLSWLFGEPVGESVREILAGAELVLASELTLVESDRVIHRAQALGEISEARAAERRARLEETSAAWHRVRLGDEVIARARRPFPVEPIRTLDALHLASALDVSTAVPDLSLLSLDHRVRECGAALGFSILPSVGDS